jgi:hypothetical protein
MQHVKILGFLAGLAGLCCCLFGTIFLSDLQRSYDQLLAARLGVIAQDVAETVNARVNLGLPLNYLSDMQGMLERTRAQSTGIQTIGIAGDDGATLYSTDRVSIGSAVALPEGNTPEILTDQDRLSVLVPLVNSFDKSIGAVMVVGTRTHLDPTHLTDLGPRIVAAIVLIVLGLVLAYLLAYLFLQDLEARNKAIEADAEDALARALETGAEVPAPPGANRPLARRVAWLIEGLREAGEEVRRMDEAG